MSGDGYQVQTADLRKHAQSVQQVTNTLDEAMAAAQQVTLGVAAYGQICGPLFVPPVLAVESVGLTTLSAAQRAANTIRTGIATTARDYDTVEQGTATGFDTMRTSGGPA